MIVCTVICGCALLQFANIEPTEGQIFRLKFVIEKTPSWCLADHARFITHDGKQVLVIDVSYCSSGEVEKTFRAIPNIVMSHPRNSVLILSDFTGATIDRAAILAVEETAVFNKPYVRKSGCVGTESFPGKIHKDVSSFSGRQFFAFGTRAEALTWLVER